MSDEAETNPQPTTNSDPGGAPAPVDWSESSNDEALPAGQNPPDTDNASVEGDDTPDPPKEAAEDDPIGDDPEPGDNDPPEFWSAERKALWDKVTDPEVRAAIKEHVRDVSVATARKLEEGAGKVRQAEESAKAALQAHEQNVQWWQQNAPIIAQIVEGEFAGIDWGKLAAENPGEWARLRQAKEARENWLHGVVGKLTQDQKAAQHRVQQAEQEARVAEHQKLAQRFPQEFGTPERAQRTYDVLSGYLAKQGIPADRIKQVYEAPVVEIIRKAYKYDQLQAKAKEVTNPRAPAQPASKTPTRIVPGAVRTANPVNEAERQAVERLRSGARLTPEEGALAFR